MSAGTALRVSRLPSRWLSATAALCSSSSLGQQPSASAALRVSSSTGQQLPESTAPRVNSYQSRQHSKLAVGSQSQQPSVTVAFQVSYTPIQQLCCTSTNSNPNSVDMRSEDSAKFNIGLMQLSLLNQLWSRRRTRPVMNVGQLCESTRLGN